MKKLICRFIAIFILGIPLLHAQEIEKAGLSTERCIVFLYTGCPEEKLLAIEILRESGSAGKEVIEALVSCLHEGTLFTSRKAGKITNDWWYVRSRSAELLGDIGDPQALTALHQSLRYDPDPVVRSCVATAIGKIGNLESIPHLDRRDIRLTAQEAMRKLR